VLIAGDPPRAFIFSSRDKNLAVLSLLERQREIYGLLVH